MTEQKDKSPVYRTAIGQDSHRFVVGDAAAERPLMLAGVRLLDAQPLDGNSDADVILHAVTNAVSGITGVNVLGELTDRMCRDGITDSSVYLKEALRHLQDGQIIHLSVSIEAARPKLAPYIPAMRQRLADLLDMPVSSVGITATSGEALTDFGRGLGMQVFCVITVRG